MNLTILANMQKTFNVKITFSTNKKPTNLSNNFSKFECTVGGKRRDFDFKNRYEEILIQILT